MRAAAHFGRDALLAGDRLGRIVIAEADAFLGSPDAVNVYGSSRPCREAFRRYVYLDFSSCELHAFHLDAPFTLKQPFIPVWDPHDFLATRVSEEAPPRHETFEPYPDGDDGLVWELVDCIKWLLRGRTELAKGYLTRLARAIEAERTDLSR